MLARSVTMHLLSLALVFFVALVNQCQPTAEGDEMVAKWNALMDNALKRKFGASYAANPGDECVKACQNTEPPGQDKISKLNDPTAKKSDFIKDIYNTETFREMCTYFNATAACVRNCPDTQRRQYLKLIFAPIKYICEDSNIVQSADCLGKVYENITMDCTMNQCAEQFGAAVIEFSNYIEAPTKASAEAMLAKGCTMVKCEVQCTKEQRVSKCGAAADGQVKEFYKRLSKSLEDLRYLSPRDYVVDIPSECNVA